MMIPATLTAWQQEEAQVELFVLDPLQVRKHFTEMQQTGLPDDFPYWAQLWPAAMALSAFILQHPEYVKNKNVAELAAGLGLPSFTAARFAKAVFCSDASTDAVKLMQKTVDHHGWKHVYPAVLNWKQAGTNDNVEMLLLSDVNYNPGDFDSLYELIQCFLKTGITILLSTPQRLPSKPFIQSLLLYCTSQYERMVNTLAGVEPISIFVLENKRVQK